jgi:uncharacterized membrane protein (DUF485 family)
MVWNTLREDKVEPAIGIFNAMLSVLLRTKQCENTSIPDVFMFLILVEAAVAFYREILATKAEPDIITFNIMLGVYYSY